MNVSGSLSTGVVRAALVLSLLAIFSGCASYMPASVPGRNALGSVEDDVEEVQQGSVVRIRLQSGEAMDGTVERVGDDALYLDRSGNYGFEEQRIEYGRIESIEVERATATSTVLIVISGVALGAAAVYFSAVGEGLGGAN